MLFHLLISACLSAGIFQAGSPCLGGQVAISSSSIRLLSKPSEKTDFITKNTGISQDWCPLVWC